jgi:hypothetical protein
VGASGKPFFTNLLRVDIVLAGFIWVFLTNLPWAWVDIVLVGFIWVFLTNLPRVDIVGFIWSQYGWVVEVGC